MTWTISFPLEYELKHWIRLFQILLGIGGIAFILFFARKSFASSNAIQEKGWISALDTTHIQQFGTWQESRFRYAKTTCLETNEEGTKLIFTFKGTGVALGLGQHAIPAYGKPSLGKLTITIDDGTPQTIYPHKEAREVVLARGLTAGEHRVSVTHSQDNGEQGCRISGFRILAKESGDLAFVLNGEDNGFLVDARAIIYQSGQEVRNVLVRNGLTGACRLTGLPPGKAYSLKLIAHGWQSQTINNITIQENKETHLPPVYLRQHQDTKPKGIHFPVLGHPTIQQPGESFRVRVAVYNNEINHVKLSRQVGPATLSRTVTIEEDSSAAFYYDREGTIKLPEDMPPGLYDLTVESSGSRGNVVRQSPRSVYVVQKYPQNPVFMTFGHLDTQGQYQAEYERQLAEIANLIGADMVLISNSVNPAYISGAHLALEMPYVITFGNHQMYGHERWYGHPVGIVDYGPNLSILNFGHPWHTDLSQADALLTSRAKTKIKVINAVEHNAPVETFLNKHNIQLIHDAHGPGKKVMTIGTTPTLRVGKLSSSSFRVVRFNNGRVESATYQEDEVAPIPFDREEVPPIGVAFDPANDGKHNTVTATITNKLEDAFLNCRVTFVLPVGDYEIDNGHIETQITSDDGKYTVMSVQVDVPQKNTTHITAQKK